jgi:glycosyltransferase involved in cell wall biosynthesis
LRITILQGACLPVPPLMGGAVEKMWFILGQKFAQKGHSVTHVSRKWQTLPTRESLNSVEYVRVVGFDAPASMLLLKVLDAIYTVNAIRAIPKDTDIIVTNTFWAPILLPFFRTAKIYVDVARMPKGQMRLYQKAAVLRANSTPVAQAIRAELSPKCFSQVSMVPNPLPSESTTKIDLRAKSKRIIYCGRIHPEKGLELLALTAKQLPNDWTIQIVGPWQTREGGGGAAYIQTLKALFINTNVAFLEPIYDIDQLNQLYQQATIFVYPSVAEKGETFGLAPLEAMAWGAVPVVSDLACFKDFIKQNENGLIFDHRSTQAQFQLNDCVQRLVADDSFRDGLAIAALDVRLSHSPDTIADLFIADFEKILK